MGKDKKDFNICRICLKSDVDEYTSLFEVYKTFLICEHINSVAHISIRQGDGLPDKICRSCLLDLETSVNFKLKCETSNHILRNNIEGETANENVDVVTIKKEELDEPEMAVDFLNADNLFTDIVQTSYLSETKPKLEIEFPSMSNQPPQCHDCGEFFKSKCKLRVHWKNIHRPKSYVCPTCRRLFKSLKAYEKHMQTTPGPCSELARGIGVRVEGEGKNRVFFCSQCDYKSNKMLHLRTHLVTHSGQRLFQCEMCHRAYTQKGSLISHQESTHMIGLHITECHICGKTFHGRRRLYKHIKIHSEEKYQCDVCKKYIKGKKSFQAHMLRHSGIKSFTCERCAASFYTLSELCNHRKKHNVRIKSLKCELCEYRSASKYLLKKHMRNHISNEKPFSCKVCGHFFATLQKLTGHERIHFEKQKYSCPLCPKMFYCRRSVSKHVIAKHNSKMLQNRGDIFTVKQEVPIVTE